MVTESVMHCPVRGKDSSYKETCEQTDIPVPTCGSGSARFRALASGEIKPQQLPIMRSKKHDIALRLVLSNSPTAISLSN